MCRELLQAFGKSGWIGRRKEKAINAIADDLRRSTCSRREHDQPGGHGLHLTDAKCLWHLAWKDKDVRARKECGQFFAAEESWELDFTAHSVCHNDLLEPLHIGRVGGISCQYGFKVDPGAVNLRQSVDKDMGAFVRHEQARKGDPQFSEIWQGVLVKTINSGTWIDRAQLGDGITRLKQIFAQPIARWRDLIERGLNARRRRIARRLVAQRMQHGNLVLQQGAHHVQAHKVEVAEQDDVGLHLLCRLYHLHRILVPHHLTILVRSYPTSNPIFPLPLQLQASGDDRLQLDLGGIRCFVEVVRIRSEYLNAMASLTQAG